jgi:hypothetical protein
MMNALRLAGLFAFLALLPSASATDLTGTWKGTVEINGNSMPLAFNLTNTGNTVTGTVAGTHATPAELHDGKVEGDTVTFWLNTDYEGQTYKLICKGKVSGDQIAFTLGTEDGSWNSDVTVKRSLSPAVEPGEPAVSSGAPAVAGTWKGSFNFEGNSVALTFNLKNSGNAVSGTVEGLPTTPAEIHEGKADGDSVTFWVSTDYQGQAYKLVYKGKVSAGQIKFTFGTGDGSWDAELTALKSL